MDPLLIDLECLKVKTYSLSGRSTVGAPSASLTMSENRSAICKEIDLSDSKRGNLIQNSRNRSSQIKFYISCNDLKQPKLSWAE